MIEKELKEGVLTLTFMHQKPQNPFGDQMQTLLMNALEEAEENDDVLSVILTGGPNRSFCVGGDFKEIINMNTSFDKINQVIGQVIELYISILKFSKPLITGIDNYAIGLGFQMAILSDYRIATDRAKFCMPEVKNGVACTLGGVLIEHLINRNEMLKICYECNMLPIGYCKEIGLVNDVVSNDQLEERSFEKAKQYGSYNSVSFRNTKRVNNQRFIDVLKSATDASIDAHYKTLSGNVHKPYMRSILKN